MRFITKVLLCVYQQFSQIQSHIVCTPIRCAMSQVNEIYALVAVRMSRKHFESVRYVIYMHWLSFDLRYESGTQIGIYIYIYHEHVKLQRRRRLHISGMYTPTPQVSIYIPT